MPDEHPLIDPYLRRKAITDDLGIDPSTFSDWIAKGYFPKPEILNPGSSREIPAWRTSVYRQWKNTRPQRLPTPISSNSYTPEARAKGRVTRAQRAAQRAQVAVEPPAEAPAPTPAIPRPRGRT